MMQMRQRLVPRLVIAGAKHDASAPVLANGAHGGSLSPNIQPNSPILVPRSVSALVPLPCKIGDYLLVEVIDSAPMFYTYKSINLKDEKCCICKVSFFFKIA